MVIGIIGGGQLARMLILAGYPLGYDFIVLDPAPDSAAGQIAKQIVGNYNDPACLQQLATRCDVITFDFENVPATALIQAGLEHKLFPNTKILSIAQDRCNEKQWFLDNAIPTTRFAVINSAADISASLDTIGLPAVLKTRRLGYDGKGQYILRDTSEITAAWSAIGEQAAILEEFIAFEREVSLISVRDRHGNKVFYPLTENQHRQGILHLSVAPYPDSALQQQAERLVTPLLEIIDYVGVLTVEFFLQNNALLANEIAPRVHNSGHWTIEAAATSQFANHIRAISGLPLGATDIYGHAAMLNFIGALPQAQDILTIPGCHFHNYGKTPKPGRKVGHATIQTPDRETLQERISKLP